MKMLVRTGAFHLDYVPGPLDSWRFPRLRLDLKLGGDLTHAGWYDSRIDGLRIRSWDTRYAMRLVMTK